MSKFSKRHDRRPRYGGTTPWKKHHAGKGAASGAVAEGVRLQKVLAAAGIGSRRQCEELISEGRVDVDGKTVTELGTRVDPQRQQIRVDGEALRRRRLIYFAINKPVGILATSRDPSGRPRVIDLAPSNERLFTVGRLDKSSEGLILVTNDGELTDRLTHPRYGVEKSYLAQVVGVPTPESMAKLRRGMRFSEGFAQAKRVHVRRTHKHSAILEIVLDEGRNREVRRLLAKIGHKVVRLQRVAIGPLRLGNLKPGESRSLGREEVEELNRAAQQGRKRKPASRRPTSVVDQRVRDETKPIIDYSLSPDSEGDEEGWLAADVELTAFVSDEAALTAAEEAALTAADELVEDASDDDDDVAPVDLSPIVPGKLKRNQRTTVIGGSERREGRKGGTGRGRRQQGRNRNSRNRQGAQGQARGKSGNQNRGRRSR